MIVSALMILFVLSGCMKARPAPSAFNSSAASSVKTQPTLYEQTTAAFEKLEQGAGVSDPNGLLQDVMDLFYRFISQKESLNLTSQEFRSISEGLQIFEVGGARIFSYQGSPAVFGESSASGYTFLQVLSDGSPQVHVIFEAETRQVWDVRQLDEGVVLLYGVETGHPRQAFVDRIQWNARHIEVEPALAPFDDGKWRIVFGLDVISRTDKQLIETYVVDMDENRAVVGSGDGQELVLVWNNDTMKFEVLSQLKQASASFL